MTELSPEPPKWMVLLRFSQVHESVIAELCTKLTRHKCIRDVSVFLLDSAINKPQNKEPVRKMDE